MIPKQYLPVGGVPMLTRAIAAFAGHPKVDDVIVVIHPEDSGLYEGRFAEFFFAVAAADLGRRASPGLRPLWA
jgi:2-C-methyl-D-erythritol 4-phosphate cytidylyltransferase